MAAIEIRTLANLPFHFSGRYPKPALVGHCTPDGVSSLSSREFFEKIRDFSLGLTGINVASGDRWVVRAPPVAAPTAVGPPPATMGSGI